MNKVILLLVLMASSSQVFAQAAGIREVKKINQLYCSNIMTGEQSWYGNVNMVLSNKTLIQCPARFVACPPEMKSGTKFIEYYFDASNFQPPKWIIRYNDENFYRLNKKAGVECIKVMEHETIKKYPLGATKPEFYVPRVGK